MELKTNLIYVMRRSCFEESKAFVLLISNLSATYCDFVHEESMELLEGLRGFEQRE